MGGPRSLTRLEFTEPKRGKEIEHKGEIVCKIAKPRAKIVPVMKPQRIEQSEEVR
jgi:hypothetical protein